MKTSRSSGPVQRFDPEPAGQELDGPVAKEVRDARRDVPEPVPDLGPDPLDLGQVLDRGQPLVQVEPQVDLREVVLGHADIGLEVDLRLDLFDGLALLLADRLVEQVHEIFVADRLHRPALPVAEEVAGAADLEVLGRQPEPRAQLGELLEGLEALLGERRELRERRDEEIGRRLAGGAAHPAAQLVELGQPEEVRPVDDEGVDERDVDAVLDDRRRDEDVVLAGDEGHHPLLEDGAGHPAVDGDDPGLGDELFHETGHLVDVLDAVVDVVDLPAAVELLADGRGHELGVPGRHDGVDGQPVPGRRLDQADVAEPGQRHVEGPRDGRRRQGQDVDIRPEALDLLLVADAEPLLLVDDEEPEVLEDDVLGQDPVGADEDIDEPLSEVLEDGLLLGPGLEPGQPLDAHREEDHPGLERLEVLARQDRGRAEDGHLLPVHDGLEGGPHRDLGLPVADVAAEQAVHGRFGLHVLDDLADGLELVLRLLELEDLLELRSPGALGAEGDAPDRLPPGVELEELPGDGLDGLPGPGLGLLPGDRAQLVEGRHDVADLGELLDEIQVLDGHEELVVVAVEDLDELPALPVHLDPLQAVEDADPVIRMDDEIAALEVLELGEEGLPRNAADEDLLLGEDVPLGEDDDLRPRIGESFVQVAEEEADLAAPRHGERDRTDSTAGMPLSASRAASLCRVPWFER